MNDNIYIIVYILKHNVIHFRKMKMQKSILISVRVTPQNADKLDNVASEHHTTRSKIIRELLENVDLCYQYLELEKARKREKTEEQYNKLLEDTMNSLTDKVTPGSMQTIGALATDVANRMLKGAIKGGRIDKK